ncbi:hypothetical protein RI054_19g85830 [Pseudoscourfieldia marina]
MAMLPLLAFLLVTAALGTGKTHAANMDPCAAPSAVAKGEAFSIGLAVWPKANASQWREKHPCRPEDGSALTGASVAYFRVETDRLTVLRLGREDETRMREAAGQGQGVTMAAFQGANARQSLVRSEARTVHDPKFGRVTALVLIARLEKGALKFAQWHDIGCGACGGNGAGYCVEHTSEDSDARAGRSCADSEKECTCEGDSCTLGVEKEPLDLINKHAGRCRLAIYVAFSGTDVHGAPLTSALQVQKLGQYSLTGLYQEGSAKGAGVAGAAVGGASGAVGSATDGAGGLVNNAGGVFGR